MHIFTTTTASPLRIVLLILLSVFLSAEAASGQQEKIVFPDRNITIKEAIDAIQRQSKYLVSVNNSDFDVSRKVKFSDGALSVYEAMTQLTAASKKTYLIQGRYIVIVPARAAKESKIFTSQESVPAIAPTTQMPENALTKPPVDVDSLERVLRARKVEFPAQIPPQPEFDEEAYYAERQRTGLVTGIPSYVDSQPAAALRTNLLYGLGTLTPNLGAEFRLNPKSTLLVNGSYNGWNSRGKRNDNEKLNHWVVGAEYRRWFCEVFNGHFMGVHGFYGFYNISGKKIPMILENGSDIHRYRGNVLGGGVSYGYQFLLGRRWNAELNAGIGVGVMNYDRYECFRCGEELGRGERRTFVAPTKLGVSLVYIID